MQHRSYVCCNFWLFSLISYKAFNFTPVLAFSANVAYHQTECKVQQSQVLHHSSSSTHHRWIGMKDYRAALFLLACYLREQFEECSCLHPQQYNNQIKTKQVLCFFTRVYTFTALNNIIWSVMFVRMSCIDSLKRIRFINVRFSGFLIFLRIPSWSSGASKSSRSLIFKGNDFKTSPLCYI